MKDGIKIYDDRAEITIDGKIAKLPFLVIDATNNALIKQMRECEERIKKLLAHAVKQTDQHAKFLDGIWIRGVEYDYLSELLNSMFRGLDDLIDRHIKDGAHTVQRQKDQFKNILTLSKAIEERNVKEK